MSNKGEGLEPLLRRLPSQGRLSFFLLFVLLSFIFWTSTKLSNSYTLEQAFVIQWIDIPAGIVPADNTPPIALSITATGIEILLYRILDKSIRLSLKGAEFQTQVGKLNLGGQKFLIQQQLFENTILNQVNPIQLEIAYSRLGEKRIAVDPQVQIQLRPGYLSDSPVQSIPDSVLVRGPQSILDTLTVIATKLVKALDVYKSLNQSIALIKHPQLQIAHEKVELALAVSRYSEKEFSLDIDVINLPEGTRVKLFPPVVKVRATLPLSVLSTVKEKDFKLVVDYNNIQLETKKELKLQMVSQPPGVKKVIWDPISVNYLIRK